MFKHSFQDSINPICCSDKDIETSLDLLSHYPNYSDKISTFLNITGSISRKILIKTYNFIVIQQQ